MYLRMVTKIKKTTKMILKWIKWKEIKKTKRKLKTKTNLRIVTKLNKLKTMKRRPKRIQWWKYKSQEGCKKCGKIFVSKFRASRKETRQLYPHLLKVWYNFREQEPSIASSKKTRQPFPKLNHVSKRVSNKNFRITKGVQMKRKSILCNNGQPAHQ